MTTTEYKKSHYLIRIGDAISQLFNVILFNGDPNYSISGESYRNNRFILRFMIDLLFKPFEQNHCKSAYENDVLKANMLVSAHEISNRS